MSIPRRTTIVSVEIIIKLILNLVVGRRRRFDCDDDTAKKLEEVADAIQVDGQVDREELVQLLRALAEPRPERDAELLMLAEAGVLHAARRLRRRIVGRAFAAKLANILDSSEEPDVEALERFRDETKHAEEEDEEKTSENATVQHPEVLAEHQRELMLLLGYDPK